MGCDEQTTLLKQASVVTNTLEITSTDRACNQIEQRNPGRLKIQMPNLKIDGSFKSIATKKGIIGDLSHGPQ